MSQDENSSPRAVPWRRVGLGIVALVVVAVVLGIWKGVDLWTGLSDETVALNVDEARFRLEAIPPEERPTLPPEEDEDLTVVDVSTTLGIPEEDVDLSGLVGIRLPYDPDFSTSPTVPDEDYTVFLIIGTDARAGLTGDRADVILLGIIPSDGSPPLLASIPRDLYLPNPCFGRATRINAALNGCGEHANGPELLAVMIEDYTGLQADHFVLFDFEGFKEVVDSFGGVEICTQYPVRDGSMSLPGGCVVADGAQTLAWVRSRKTQENVDGTWRTMAGVNDLTRNQRQREVMLTLLSTARSESSLGALVAATEALSDDMTIDDGFTFGRAVGLAWEMRTLSLSTIRTVGVAVENHTTSGGASVLIPTIGFDDLFLDALSN